MEERRARVLEENRRRQVERLARVRHQLKSALGVESVLFAPNRIDQLLLDEGVSAEACGYAISELLSSTDEDFQRGLDAIQSLFRERSRRTAEVWKEVRRPEESRNDMIDEAVLSGLGLPAETFVVGWRKARMSSYTRSTEIQFLLEQERSDPGSTAFLHREFGITIFGRFPVAVLRRQKRMAANAELPYGIVIMARADHGDAFYHSLRDPLQKLYDDLGDDGLLRVIEVENKTELARRLLTLNARYGKTQKVQFAVVAAHGETQYFRLGEMTFGQDAERQRVTVKDLLGRGIRRGKDFFVERPSIVLASCSTGFEGGIGQQLSELYDADVSAPWAPTGSVELHAQVEDGRIRLKGTFASPHSGNDLTESYSSGARDV